VANLLVFDSRQNRVAAAAAPAFSSKTIFTDKKYNVSAPEFSPGVQGTNPTEVMPGESYEMQTR
jgi:hypothetical protein